MVDVPDVVIAGRHVGIGRPVFIVAEAGVNHNGDLALARQLIDAAAAAGADAVKFQVYRTSELIADATPKPAYQQRVTAAEEPWSEMLRRLELAPGDVVSLRDHAAAAGICFLCTPFDLLSAAFLAELGLPAFKVSSTDLGNRPLLEFVAGTGRPLLVSTGMSRLGDVDAAMRWIEEAGGAPCRLVLLHCVTDYPAAPGDTNLRAMATMREAFGVPVGYSDHTVGGEVAIAAVALGACVIEKHLTLDRTLPGPDHTSSTEPREFAQMVQQLRRVGLALGDGRKRPAPPEEPTRRLAAKSVIALRDLQPGDVLTQNNVGIRRPASGLPPDLYRDLLGLTVRQPVQSGEGVQFKHFRKT